MVSLSPSETLIRDEAGLPPATRPAVLIWRRFRRHKGALIGGAVLVALALLAVLAPAIESWRGQDHEAVNLFNRFQPASAEHPLGTDDLGRDLLMRLIYGGRISLFVGLVTACLTASIGTVIGLVSGWYGGRVDAFLMRLCDGWITLPLLPLLIVLAAVDPTKVGLPAAIAKSPDLSLYRIVLIISLVAWTTSARLVRGVTLSLKTRDFVQAAVAQGASTARILFVHILPNALSPILVAATLASGNIILLESTLSFFGLGIQPPVASWGNILTNAQEIIWSQPMQAIYPGVLIFATVISLNFVGDGLQDAFDPRTEGR
ncbi:MAG: ABC transporter permease [Alphaproteobacteria bacterium]|nr:ABC transporter permease [Alphaproteobacteria bacterium]